MHKWSFLTEKNITCGVSQGSVLGPPAVSSLSKRFADDTSLSDSSPGIESLILDANTELKKAAKWFQANRFTLNVSKTKYIVFRNKNMHFDPSCCNKSIGNEILEKIGNDCVQICWTLT